MNEAVKVIIGIIFVLILPGLSWSFVFFAPGKIDVIERITLMIALSIAIVPLVTFYANLIGISVTAESVIMEVIFIVTIAMAIVGIREFQQYFKKSH